MIAPEEIVDLAEFLKRKDIHSSPYQLFAARQVLLSEWAQETHSGALVRLSTLLGPIFCRTAEEQQCFEQLYLQWLRQRSGRPKTLSTVPPSAPTPLENPPIHWRMHVAVVGLLIFLVLAGWFLWKDLWPRQLVGQVVAEGTLEGRLTVQLGEAQKIELEDDGTFRLSFMAKDMPLELTVEAEAYLLSKTLVGESIRANRNWLYLNPINLSKKLDIGTIQLAKEEVEPDPPPDVSPSGSSPSTLSIEKIADLPVPPPSLSVRLNRWKAIGSLLPILLTLLWLGYRKLRQPSLQRQSSRIPPELKHVHVEAGTQQIFPSISLRQLTQRLRQTTFVESAELDVARTIQHTINQGGLFTPAYGSKREPGYVALIDRATMADHQAHLAAQLVKDLAKGYVLVRQYEFDEQPTMLQLVDPLQSSPPHVDPRAGLATALEVMPLEDLHAKFPARRMLCFGDPSLCFDPLTGRLRSWVDVLESWEERYWFSSNVDRTWGPAEQVLSRRGFQVIPLTRLGLQLFARALEQSPSSEKGKKKEQKVGYSSYERMPERWLERHPPSSETKRKLLDDLRQDLGVDGFRWLAACAAYPEIHWALTLEWGARLFGQTITVEHLLPKLTRLVWFRHAFMPDWFRQALYEGLTPDEAEHISQELSEILSAVNPDQKEGLELAIATKPGKPKKTSEAKGVLGKWVARLRRKLKLQAMGQVAEEGSPLHDYVMLQFLSGKQGKALTPYAPKAFLNLLFPKGQPWLGFRPFTLLAVAALASGGLWDWWDPLPVPLPSSIKALEMADRGNTVLVGLENGRLVEWDRQTNQVKRDYVDYPAAVTHIAYSDDGNFLVGGYQDGTLHVFDQEGGQDYHVPNEWNSSFSSMAFWPRADNIPRLVTTSAKQYVVWNNFTPETPQGFGYVDITALAFSSKGDWAAGGNSLGEIFTASAADFDLNDLFNVDLSFESSPRDAGALESLAWDPSGTFIMAQHADGTLRIWDNSSRKELAKTEGPLAGIASMNWLSSEEVLLSLVGADGLELWRIDIPSQFLKQEINIIEEERAAFRKAREEARQREALAAERAQDKIDAQKRVEAKRQADLAAKKKAQQDTKRRVAKKTQVRPEYDITGVWKKQTDPNFSYSFEQSGDRVTMKEVETTEEGATVTAVGKGRLLGNRLEMAYDTFLGTQGRAMVTLSEDGRNLQGIYLDTSTNIPVDISLVRMEEDPESPDSKIQQQENVQPAQQQEEAQQIEEPPTQVVESPTQIGKFARKITRKDGAPMVLVPAGEFTMGARDDDKKAADDERPAHQVYLDAFYIDQYEVTTTRYAKFFQTTKRAEPDFWSDQVLKKHSNKPVVGVSWEDAQAYCEWAGKQLPTEAQWEKAARGIDQRLYPWGNEPPNNKYANFGQGEGYGKLKDVGSLEGGQSPFWVFNLAGNASEWVVDWYEKNLYQQLANSTEVVKNPRSMKGSGRARRGGSSNSGPWDLRSSDRSQYIPKDHSPPLMGFRCAQGAR